MCDRGQPSVSSGTRDGKGEQECLAVEIVSKLRRRITLRALGADVLRHARSRPAPKASRSASRLYRIATLQQGKQHWNHCSPPEIEAQNESHKRHFRQIREPSFRASGRQPSRGRHRAQRSHVGGPEPPGGRFAIPRTAKPL
jgi:hypothetical protein